MKSVALDTNVLLRLAEPGHARHELTADAVERLLSTDHRLVLLPQVVYEFWAVATRTLKFNGLGMTAAEADLLIDKFAHYLPVLRDERGVYGRWRELAGTYGVTGANSHDMRIVAAMIRHSIPTLLTSNAGDFQRYAEIEVLTPEAAGHPRMRFPLPRWASREERRTSSRSPARGCSGQVARIGQSPPWPPSVEDDGGMPPIATQKKAAMLDRHGDLFPEMDPQTGSRKL